MELGVRKPLVSIFQRAAPGWSGLLISLMLCSFSLHRSWGQFDFLAFLAMFSAVTLAWVVFIRGSFPLDSFGNPALLLGIFVFILSLCLWIKPNVYHLANYSGFDVTRQRGFGLALAAVVASQVVGFFLDSKNKKLSYWMACCGILFVGGVVISLVPKPAIDVHPFNTMAAQSSWQLQNMYQLKYPDIYDGFYSFKPCFPYLPGTLLWSMPGWLWGDVRWGLWIGLAITMIMALKLNNSNSPLLFLCPVLFYMLECSLVDLGLMPLFIGGMILLRKQKWILSGVVLGLAAASKQYAFIPLLLAGMLTFLSVSQKAAWRLLLSGALTGVLAVAPWFFHDPVLFTKSTVLSHLNAEPRMDALTLYAFFNFLHLVWPKYLGIFVSLASIAGISFALARFGGSLVYGVALGSAAIYGAIFLFGSQAFGNYYFLVFLFLSIALLDRVFPRSS